MRQKPMRRKSIRRSGVNGRNAPVYLMGMAVIALAFFFIGNSGINAEGEIYTDKNNVAIHGYDTVSYFTEKEPQKGSAEFTHKWKDATWQFASADNRNLFADNPEKYAPQFGGY